MNLLLSAAFALLSFFLSVQPNGTNTNETTFNQTSSSLADIITMEEEALMVTITDSSNGPIINIEVVTPLAVTVLDINGCGAQSCETDLSALSSGSYTVFVTTQSSHTFSGEITIE